MEEIISLWLKNMGLSSQATLYVSKIILFIFIIIIVWLLNLIAKFFLFRIVKKMTLKTKNKWDDILFDKGVIKKIASIIPVMAIYILITFLLPSLYVIIHVKRLILSYMIGLGIWIIFSLLDTIEFIYNGYEISRKRPIKGYLQIFKILTLVIGVIIIISIIINQSPWGLIAGLGAMTAVLLLIFKDTILGFVASIELSSNDMIQIGDTITLMNTDIDGEVIDISLYTVKIQNFDRSISMIPAYYLINNAYKNWKNIKESGVRRIKRALFIDINSVKFIDEADIEKLKRKKEISEFIMKKLSISKNSKITNLTLLRLFIQNYLQTHPDSSKENSIIVRHLEPTPTGLPLELYLYVKEKDFNLFENIQAEIFDYLIAVIPLFELKIFQHKST